MLHLRHFASCVSHSHVQARGQQKKPHYPGRMRGREVLLPDTRYPPCPPRRRSASGAGSNARAWLRTAERFRDTFMTGDHVACFGRCQISKYQLLVIPTSPLPAPERVPPRELSLCRSRAGDPPSICYSCRRVPRGPGIVQLEMVGKPEPDGSGWPRTKRESRVQRIHRRGACGEGRVRNEDLQPAGPDILDT